MRTVSLASCLLVLAAPLAAQRFNGTFAMQGQAGPVVLVLSQAANGAVTGTLSGNGVSFQIEAQPEEQSIVGIASGQQGRLFFQADVDGNQIVMIFVEPGPDGSPNYDTAQQLVFTRQAGGAGGAMGALGMGSGAGMGQGQGGMQPAQPGRMGGGQPGGLDDGTPLGREWAQGLAGRKLTRLDSYSSGSAGGYSFQEELTLCSNGEYLYQKQSSVSVDVGGAFGNTGGNDREIGRWRIVTQGQVAGLELRAQNGQVALVRLDFQNDLVHIDGGKVYRTAAEVCQ